MTEPRNTKRADRLALVEAGQRYHAAKLAYATSTNTDDAWQWRELCIAKAHLLHVAEQYAVGRRRASVAFGHRFYAKQKARA